MLNWSQVHRQLSTLETKVDDQCNGWKNFIEKSFKRQMFERRTVPDVHPESGSAGLPKATVWVLYYQDDANTQVKQAAAGRKDQHVDDSLLSNPGFDSLIQVLDQAKTIQEMRKQSAFTIASNKINPPI